MHNSEDAASVLNNANSVLSDDVESLKSQFKADAFDYVDIASRQAWERSLLEWPLLSEWNAWSQREHD